jgi:O-antigen/teichoic acid export membrane protein
LIVYFYSTTDAGQFSLVLRTVSVPFVLIITSVADVFHKKMAELYIDSPDTMIIFLKKTAKNLFVIGMLPTVLIFLWGKYIFIIVFGKQWGGAGEIVALIMPWLLAKLIVSPLSRVIYVLQAQKIKLVYDMLSLSVQVGSLSICSYFHVNFINCVGILSIMNVLLFIIYYILIFFVTNQSIKNKSIVCVE